MKVCIIPGHTDQSEGAVSTDGRYSEFSIMRHVFSCDKIHTSFDLLEWERLLYHNVFGAMSYSAQLREKINFINSFEPKCAIEMHMNASTNVSAHGFEIIYTSKKGKLLAKHITNSLIENGILPNRQSHILSLFRLFNVLKFRRILHMRNLGRNLRFLRKTKMPALIIEVGFITNEDDLKTILNENFQEILRKSIIVGITEWAKEVNLTGTT